MTSVSDGDMTSVSDEADAAATAGRPVRPTGVSFGTDDASGAQARSATSGTVDCSLLPQRREDRRLMALPRRQHQRHRLAAALRAEMNLRRESATAPPQRCRFRIPRFAPAACWCARTTVPSTQCTRQSRCPAAAASRWMAATSRSQTPAGVQRRTRVSTLGHGPDRSGRSRHGAPVASFHRMPFSTSRSSLRGAPGVRGGRRRARRTHSAALRSCRRRLPHLQEVTINQHYAPSANSAIEDRP